MTRPATTAFDLVSMARDLLREGETTAGVWPRAAAVLARQAIEMVLDELWQLRAPGLQYVTARCQLLCLPAFLGNDELAERTSAAWGALSTVLHHHPYELPPTHLELLGWIEVVWDLANRVAQVEREAAAPRR